MQTFQNWETGRDRSAVHLGPGIATGAPDEPDATRLDREGNMELEHIRYERRGHVGWVTLDRPDARNAYSDAMIDSLVRALDHAEDDDEVWVVVLTGEGRAFSAGGDLKAMRDRTGMFAGDSARLRTAYIRNIQRVPRRLLRFDKPMIAAVNGPAIGAGLDLACMCDVRVASSKAKFGSTFVRVGLIPGDGGAYFLARAIGYAKAAELVLTARVIGADDALGLGLVSRVVAPEELEATAMALAEEMCGNAPLAIRLARQAMIQSWNLTPDQALQLAATYQGIVQRTPDHDEGVAAILERRDPSFEG
jgi:enoyl-CoA hydratase/carnithine racemase